MRSATWCLVSLIAMCGLSGFAQAQGGVFVIDKDHAEVRFSWNHLGLSRQSGRFKDVIGRLAFDPAQPEKAEVDVTIKAATVMTGIGALDRVLRDTNDYLRVGDHPDISFKSTEVVPTGPKTANVSGDLTLNGVTKPVSLAVVWNFLGEHPLAGINPIYQGVTAAGFSARTQILRSEWGITRGIPLVSDEIRIAIEVELHKLQ